MPHSLLHNSRKDREVETGSNQKWKAIGLFERNQALYTRIREDRLRTVAEKDRDHLSFVVVSRCIQRRSTMGIFLIRIATPIHDSLDNIWRYLSVAGVKQTSFSIFGS